MENTNTPDLNEKQQPDQGQTDKSNELGFNPPPVVDSDEKSKTDQDAADKADEVNKGPEKSVEKNNAGDKQVKKKTKKAIAKSKIDKQIASTEYVLRDVNLYKKTKGDKGIYLVSIEDIEGHTTVTEKRANFLAKNKPRSYLIYKTGNEPVLAAMTAKAENAEISAENKSLKDELAEMKAKMAKMETERSR